MFGWIRDRKAKKEAMAMAAEAAEVAAKEKWARQQMSEMRGIEMDVKANAGGERKPPRREAFVPPRPPSNPALDAVYKAGGGAPDSSGSSGDL